MDALYIKKGFSDLMMKVTAQKPTQRDFLLNHPRRHLAEQNVMKEMRVMSFTWGAKFQKKQLDELITAGATFFCLAAIKQKEDELLTAAERQRRIDKNFELERTQAMADDMMKEAMSTAISGPGADIPNAQTPDTGASS